jgi:hypothetical protein
MWNLYLMRAHDIADERRRESERDSRSREQRQAVPKGPRPKTRRKLETEHTDR